MVAVKFCESRVSAAAAILSGSAAILVVRNVSVPVARRSCCSSGTITGDETKKVAASGLCEARGGILIHKVSIVARPYTTFTDQ